MHKCLNKVCMPNVYNYSINRYCKMILNVLAQKSTSKKNTSLNQVENKQAEERREVVV